MEEQQMQEQQKKAVFTVKGGPWPYTMIYDFNAVADAEPIVGLNLLGAMATNIRSASQIRGLVYAFLHPANPALTLAEAGDLLAKDYRAVAGALDELINLVNDEDEDADPKPAAKADPPPEPSPASAE